MNSKSGSSRLGVRAGFGFMAAVCLFWIGAGGRAGAEEGVPHRWPANVHVVKLKLSADEFKKPGFELELPQLRIYDSQERLLHETIGFNKEQLAANLTRLFQSPPAAAAGKVLAGEMDRFEAGDGHPASPLPAADFQLVEWWAEWCLPCHAQATQLARILGARSGTRFNLVRVDTSEAGMEAQKMFRVDASKIDPKLLEKLRDPKVPVEEKRKILEALQDPPADPKPDG